MFFSRNKFSNKTFLAELFKTHPDEETLSEMLKDKNININHKDKNNNSFLHICLLENKIKSALWLIEHGADQNLYNNNQKRPIELAIEKNNYQLLQAMLLTNDINVNKKDSFGRILLQDAVMAGYEKIAKTLVKYESDINSKDINGRNVIFDALSYGDEDLIDYILSLDDLELNNLDINLNTVMHHPQVINNDKIAIKLIEAGADLTLRDKDGHTYLCNTALRGKEASEIIDIALKNGADINSRVAGNNTILMELISATTKLSSYEKNRRESLFDITKNILLHGVDIDAIDNQNETVLFKAIRVRDFELISFLYFDNLGLYSEDLATKPISAAIIEYDTV